MSSVDTRDVARDSLLVFADLTVEGQPAPSRVKVRNLSSGGMMADVDGLSVSRGDRIGIELRTIGKVTGSVAWVQGSRIGIAFDRGVDPKAAREPTGQDDPQDRFRPAAALSRQPDEDRPLRTI